MASPIFSTNQETIAATSNVIGSIEQLSRKTLLGSQPDCLSKERAMPDFVYKLYEFENSQEIRAIIGEKFFV